MSDLSLIIDSRSAVQASKDILNIGDSMQDTSKSAQASASVFVSAFNKMEKSIDLATKANVAYAKNAQAVFNTTLGIGKSFNSAEASAAVFAKELGKASQAAFDYARSSQQAINNTLGVNREFNSAEASASIFARELDKIDAAAERAEAQLDRMGVGVGRTANKMNRFGMVSQQVGYQVGDFFVQVQSGQSALVAFAQQGTQLAGLLPGVAGAIIGIGLAVSTAVIGPMLRLRETTQDATTQIQELEAATAQLNEANKIYSTDGLQSVLDKYGEMNQEILLLIERQRQYATDNAMVQAKEAVESIAGEFDDLLTNLELYNSYISAGTPSALVDARDLAAEIQEQFGLTVIEAQSLQYAMQAATRTSELDTMASGLATVATILEDSSIKGTALYGTLLDSESAIRALNNEASGIGGWLGAAISGAAAFASNLWNAAGAARAAAMGSGGPLSPATVYGLNAATRGLAPEFAPTGSFSGSSPPSRPMDLGISTGSAGGGSGGGGGTQNDPLADLIEKIRLEEELLGLTEDQMEVYKALGADRSRYSAEEIASVTAEVEALRLKQEQLEEMSRGQESLANTLERSFESTFTSIIDGTKDMDDAFKDMAKSILAELFRVLVTQQLVGSFSGGSGTGIVGSIMSMVTGGGTTPVVGPSTGGMLTGKTTSGRMAGGGGVTQNINFNVSANGDDSVKRIVTKLVPQISKAAEAGIINSRQRGGSMRKTFV